MINGRRNATMQKLGHSTQRYSLAEKKLKYYENIGEYK
jgi:hypothetical protein